MVNVFPEPAEALYTVNGFMFLVKCLPVIEEFKTEFHTYSFKVMWCDTAE